MVLTDRNDLDDQLFTTFSRCADLLRQPPVQAESRADLRAKLAVESGGVVFTTIQKFFPEEKGTGIPCFPAGSRRRGDQRQDPVDQAARLRLSQPRALPPLRRLVAHSGEVDHPFRSETDR